MKLCRLKACLLLILASLTFPACITNSESNGKDDENLPIIIPRVEEINTVSWRHAENLPTVRPIGVVLRGVLNDNWDRLQYQTKLDPYDILVNFANTFHKPKPKDIILLPIRATSQEPLAFSGTKEEMVTTLKKKIDQYKFNAGLLMRIDYYEPGIKFSSLGDQYNPEMKLTFWLVNSEGRKIWTVQTAVRTVKPLPNNVAIDQVKSVYALLNRAFEEVISEFTKFWQSPEVIARLQTAKFVDFKRPNQPVGDSKIITPEYSKPLTGGATSLKGAGFSENSD